MGGSNPARARRLDDGHFFWGAATSSYQIEGAADRDGRGPSIWDRFSAIEGNIEDGSTGAEACCHYDRFREDVGLIAELGLDAYRFSVAWPRILPEGTGRIEPRGLDFYDRLVDALLEAGVTPFATLYHWDLPAALQDRGGWASRETALAFVDYAGVVADRLGDRVGHWITQNEPWCAAILGHQDGAHAPGHKDPREALTVAHNLLLSHGWATEALRARAPGAQVGLSHMYLHCEPASASEADAAAARHLDGVFNRWFLDPLYGRGYPEDMVQAFVAQGSLPQDGLPFVEPGDLDVIATPTDFLGVNYYTRAIMRSGRIPEADNLPRERFGPADEDRTDMGWEVYPAGLETGLRRLHADYAPPALLVTENGAAYATGPDATGRVQDDRRIEFLRGHIEAVWAAKAAGAPVHGYFLWSLLDNFEWAFGYDRRFGIVWTDYETLERTPKASAHFFSETIRRNGVEA